MSLPCPDDLPTADDLPLLRVLEAGDEPAEGEPRGRRDEPPPRLALHGVSAAVGGLTGLALGALGRAALRGAGALVVTPWSLGVAAVASGAMLVTVLARLMDEARGQPLRLVDGDATREVHYRRRPEVLRRAAGLLAFRAGAATLVVGAAAWGASHQLRLPAFALPRIGPAFFAYAAGAATVTLALGLAEALFRLTRKEGLDDHAPALMGPAVLGVGAGLAGLLG